MISHEMPCSHFGAWDAFSETKTSVHCLANSRPAEGEDRAIISHILGFTVEELVGLPTQDDIGLGELCPACGRCIMVLMTKVLTVYLWLDR